MQRVMKQMGSILCILLTLLVSVLPVLGAEPADRSAIVRTGMTICGAALGLAAGTAIGAGFSLDAIDTPLSSALLLTIPVAAAGTAAGALAGWWVADVTLRHQPSPAFSIIEGAGLGLLGGALVGGIAFSLNFLLAYHILEVPEGYWGRYDYPWTIGMAVFAGGFWGGLAGVAVGALAVPIISLYMGF